MGNVIRFFDRTDLAGLSEQEYDEALETYQEECLRRGVLPHNGHGVRALTHEDIDRAAGVITAISAIPSLGEGLVGFGLELDGGHWYWNENAAFNGNEIVLVSISKPNLSMVEAREAVVKGVEVARREHEGYAEEARRDGDTTSCLPLYVRALEFEEAVA